MFQVSRLENGLTVASAEMPHMASVSVGIWVGVGSRFEPESVCGASHFIEHMLFKGTARRSPREISQAVEGIGGYLNAFTAEESTCFHARARADRLELLLDVLLDMFTASRFDPEDVDKERAVIKEEVAMYLDQPHQRVQEMLTEVVWPGQPLGRPLTGTFASLDGLDRRVLVDFHRCNYVAQDTVLAAAGRVTHRRLMDLGRRMTSALATGRQPVFEPARDAQSEPRLCLFTKDTEQAQLALGIRACSRHDERRFALRLLNTMLGENMSSRLFQLVREDRGLAYSIYSSLGVYADTGLMVISAGLDPGNLRPVLLLVRDELRRLRRSAPSRRELERAKEYVLGQIDLSLESTEHQMNWVGEQLLSYGRVHSPARVKRRLERVTAREIQQLARDMFRADRMNLALVSPQKSMRGLKPLLDV
jgi:predicted Zn-dependent peptidase